SRTRARPRPVDVLAAGPVPAGLVGGDVRGRARVRDPHHRDLRLREALRKVAVLRVALDRLHPQVVEAAVDLRDATALDDQVEAAPRLDELARRVALAAEVAAAVIGAVRVPGPVHLRHQADVDRLVAVRDLAV